MQLSKLISDSSLPLAPNKSVFPGLEMAFTSNGVVQGDGVNTKGSITDLITGRVFTPITVADALSNLVPAGTFGGLNGAGDVMLGAGAPMPNFSTKNILMITVRHSASAADGIELIGFNNAGGSYNQLYTRSDAGTIFIKSSGNSMTGGAVTGFAAGIWAHAMVFDRSQASGILAVTHRVAGPASNLAVAGSTKVGAAWTVVSDPINNLGSDMALPSVANASQNYRYGIYLFGFTNPTGILQATLNPVLRWMQRNPTKGLHPFLAKLT